MTKPDLSPPPRPGSRSEPALAPHARPATSTGSNACGAVNTTRNSPTPVLPSPAPASHVTRPHRPRLSARPRCSLIGPPALFTLYGQVLTLCGRPLAVVQPQSLDVIRARAMQINRGILGIGVRGRPGTGSARSWRPHLKAEISGRTNEILRGKVEALRGGNPEAPEPARLGGLFGRHPIPKCFLGLLCAWPSVRPVRDPHHECTIRASARGAGETGRLPGGGDFLQRPQGHIHSFSEGVFIGAYCMPGLWGCTS